MAKAETPRPIFLRSTGGLPSLESLHGWESQYERILRCREKLREDQSLDMFLTFFLNCYALRDWLVTSNTIPQHEIDEQIQADFFFSLCRDICNRSKHLVLSRPSVDANFFICREYRGPDQPPALVVCADGKNTDLGDLAGKSIEFWDRVLTARGLTVTKRQL